jgi:hypothetical protein
MTTKKIHGMKVMAMEKISITTSMMILCDINTLYAQFSLFI